MFDLRKIFHLRKIFAVPKDFLKSKIYCATNVADQEDSSLSKKSEGISKKYQETKMQPVT